MKKTTVILLLSFLISMIGCETAKHTAKMQRKYCPVTHDSIVNNTIVKTERHDSIIYVSSDMQLLHVNYPCDSNKLKKFDVKQTKNGIHQEVISNGKGIDVECNADSLKEVIKGLNVKITETNSHTETKVVTEKCALRHHSGWDTFCNYFTIGSLILILLIIVWKIAKISIPKLPV